MDPEEEEIRGLKAQRRMVLVCIVPWVAKKHVVSARPLRFGKPKGVWLANQKRRPGPTKV